ncbi:glutaredoxin-C9-like [Impatiens glandulifera]|uniref:glutaredoxin-C9-like n=1 Tax=Impatiens glandulifera TaxID=253017 RepID=UPI001FB10E7F|nr:glutaredoxin-C9-like [Impatiens glandulifera]
MQEAIAYKTWLFRPTSDAGSLTTPEVEERAPKTCRRTSSRSEKMVSENAVIVFGRRGCCMCCVAKTLLLGHGVNSPVVEIDEKEETMVMEELRMAGIGATAEMKFPAVFIGGRYFGGLERVMGAHISGELVPILKKAGALWL